MARLVAPNDGAREVDIRTPRGTKRYRGKSGGMYEVDNPADINTMRASGFTEASLMGVATNTGTGYPCRSCGFGSWFKKCSKCGAVND